MTTLSDGRGNVKSGERGGKRAGDRLIIFLKSLPFFLITTTRGMAFIQRHAPQRTLYMPGGNLDIHQAFRLQ